MLPSSLRPPRSLRFVFLDLFRISNFVLRICFGFCASDFGFHAFRCFEFWTAPSAAARTSFTSKSMDAGDVRVWAERE